MTAEVITDEKALSVLREVVAERPEYTYKAPEYMCEEGSSCFYVHNDEDGTPVGAGCAIGVVLHRLGVPLEKLAGYEGLPAWTVTDRLFPELSNRTKGVLNDMQMRQDVGDAWGLAYAKATGETI
ncbi:hypothetical protein [Streptomyces pseudogriseolus]|uniref:hypothetical protein n=1 Tax=Streptomyces pseudogriseolus TaxID=36817 RepID=UPI003FA1C0B3